MALLRTRSVGVRRLSLILGLISGTYFMVTQHTPIVGENTVSLNLLNMAILFAVGFVATWLIVRVIAWVIEGFVQDRS